VVLLLADENFNHHIVRAVRRQRPGIDLITAQDARLGAMSDPELLQWAAERERVVLSHDVQTSIGFAHERVANGLHMPGVTIVREAFNVGRVVEDLLIVIECSLKEEIEGHVRYVPL
jgi:hypothetical protein